MERRRKTVSFLYFVSQWTMLTRRRTGEREGDGPFGEIETTTDDEKKEDHGVLQEKRWTEEEEGESGEE